MKKVLFLSLTLILLSCNSSPVFEGKVEMKQNIWNRFNFLIFEVPVMEGELIDFDLEVGYTTDYPWDELITNITFYLPDGSMLSSDYTFPLIQDVDSETKVWLQTFSIRKQTKFSSTGLCKVRVENKMTKVQTPGISSVGMTARRSK